VEMCKGNSKCNMIIKNKISNYNILLQIAKYHQDTE
jgi:hypothetical protein